MSTICRQCGKQLPKDRHGAEQLCEHCKSKNICKHCNKKFKPSKSNPTQEYCNEICWKKAHGLK